MLRRWWTAKYQLPWTHEAFQESSIFDLLVERYEDLFESNPDALFEAGKNEDGEYEFVDTGDALLDKWEKELAMGLTPDLTEGMTKEALDRMAQEQKKVQRAKELVGKVEEGDLLEKLIGSNRGTDMVSREDANYLRDNVIGGGRSASVPARPVGRRR